MICRRGFSFVQLSTAALIWAFAPPVTAAEPAGAENATPARPDSPVVLVEAESFDELGGWVVDQQFMDQMGSPYLLAHGLGKPVDNAATTVEIPEPGRYRVWVRTRDWVAPWKAPGAPGRFKLLVDGRPLPVTFGTEGADWHWHDGGVVEMPRGAASLALHDLTGFEGRCDAIVFSADPNFVPPNEEPAMAAFRRRLLGLPEQPVSAGEYDLVVVGGGLAGVCASLSAARLGLSVALIQDRPVLGGNNSNEVRIPLKGEINFRPYPRIGDVVWEMDSPRRYAGPYPEGAYDDQRRRKLVEAEPNIELFLNHFANEVHTHQGRITAVVAQNTRTGVRRRFEGQWFADCTGDGTIGYRAGADFKMTLPGRMGQSNLWSVEDTSEPAPFPRCPWALDLSDKPFPGRKGTEDDYRWTQGLKSLGRWFWESGYDHHPFEKMEYVRDWNFRAMYGAWDCLKNVDGLYPNHKIAWAAYVTGKRESRRLLGDVVLTEEDLIEYREYPDGCVPAAWTIDLHWPDPRYAEGFEGDEFIATSDPPRTRWPYWIPYRCLYSRNVPNLFMAGRDISVTHEALGMVRVMRTTGMMGEVLGMAAAVCKRRDADPRAVYADYLDELKELMRRGVGKSTPPRLTDPPAWREGAKNLAPEATVESIDGSEGAGLWIRRLSDQQYNLRQNGTRWMNDDRLPHTVEFRWSEPRTLGAARIVSGYYQNQGEVGMPITSFALQTYRDGRWRDVPETRVRNNQRIDWTARFAPVQTDRLRLIIEETPAGVSRIWEVELFAPVKD
jgi:hypothetical protein